MIYMMKYVRIWLLYHHSFTFVHIKFQGLLSQSFNITCALLGLKVRLLCALRSTWRQPGSLSRTLRRTDPWTTSVCSSTWPMTQRTTCHKEKVQTELEDEFLITQIHLKVTCHNRQVTFSSAYCGNQDSQEIHPQKLKK